MIDSTDTVELMLERICDSRNEKKVLKIILLLWEDERTKQFVKDGKCLLTQTGPYFFDQLEHIFDEHYIPSDQVGSQKIVTVLYPTAITAALVISDYYFTITTQNLKLVASRLTSSDRFALPGLNKVISS